MNGLNTFTKACIEALYFTETGSDEQPSTDTELDEDCILNLEADCRSFWHRFGCYIETEIANGSSDATIEHAGQDFWLTRNGHGAGFWDGKWPIYGDMLTNAAKGYGEFYPDFHPLD